MTSPHVLYRRGGESRVGALACSLACLITLSACDGRDPAQTPAREPAPESAQAPDPAAAPALRDWNVVLLTLDTTRADHLGCYGQENAGTPNFDGLAEEGVLFESNYASNPVTQAAHSTILTGVYPMVHGVRDNTFFKLPEIRTTLAERLRDAGWKTGAAIGGFPLVREFGLSQGFDFYDDDITGNREDFRGRPDQRRGGSWYDERPAAQVNDAILPWLREHAQERFFVWLHYWDPHLPHIAPAPYSQIYAHDGYQAEIAYADTSFGTILRELRDAGVYDRTLIVVTGDHGEGFLEHDELTHAFLAYDSTLHVPLIVKIPEFAGGRRVRQHVGTVDIVPTILDLLGFERPDDVQGRSLVELARDPARDDDPAPAYYAESFSPRLSHGCGELRVLFDGDLKLIHGPRKELFDRGSDRPELRDLLASRADEASRMEEELGRFIRDHASREAGEAAHQVSDQTRERLEALGYLDSGGSGATAGEEILRTDGDPPQECIETVNLGQRLRQQLGAGQFAIARKTAEKLVAAAPGNVFNRASLASALLGLNKPSEAAAVVEGIEDLGRGDASVFLQTAEAVFDAGERERGLALARRVLAVKKTAAGHVVLARMARDTGDGETFEREIRAALALDEKAAAARQALADHLLDGGDLDRAEAELKTLLEQHPLEAEPELGWARLLAARGRHEEALARVERVLRLQPNQCRGLLQKIELLVALERGSEAARVRRDLERWCKADEWRTKARKAMEKV